MVILADDLSQSLLALSLLGQSPEANEIIVKNWASLLHSSDPLIKSCDTVTEISLLAIDSIAERTNSSLQTNNRRFILQ